MMLDIFIVLLYVGEHVMHIMFGVPPLQGQSTDEAGLQSAEDVKGRVATVGCRVTDPAN